MLVMASVTEKQINAYASSPYLTIDHVTANGFQASWSNLPDREEYTSFEIYLNGVFVDLISTPDVSDYLFTDLSPSTNYEIRIVGYNGDTKGYEETTTGSTSTAELVKSSNSTGVFFPKPIIGTNGIVTIDGFDTEKLINGSRLFIIIPDTRLGKAQLDLTADQVKNMRASNATLSISFLDARLVFNTNNLKDDNASSIILTKVTTDLPEDEKAISSIFDFSIKQGEELISTFSTPVKIGFDNINATSIEKLKVFYFNEVTGKWENIGGEFGIWEDGSGLGFVTTTVTHFSIYTIMEAIEQTDSAHTPPINNGGSTGLIDKSSNTSTNTPAGLISESSNTPINTPAGSNVNTIDGHRLPDTASNNFNFITLGTILVLSALLIMFLHKKRQNITE